MASDQLNPDFSQHVVMRTAQMEWQASPSPSVWRKRLDLVGPAETGHVTSIVRYDANSNFPPHDHPDGEEIFVLDGVFSDEHGDFPAGTFLLNPEGFRHAPFSKEGCIIFVKLRQYPGQDRRHVVVDTKNTVWTDAGDGLQTMPLYGEAEHAETIALWQLNAGAALTLHASGGAELFLIAGDIRNTEDRYTTGDWLRYPSGADIKLRAVDECVLYVKTGHFPA